MKSKKFLTGIKGIFEIQRPLRDWASRPSQAPASLARVACGHAPAQRVDLSAGRRRGSGSDSSAKQVGSRRFLARYRYTRKNSTAIKAASPIPRGRTID